MGVSAEFAEATPCWISQLSIKLYDLEKRCYFVQHRAWTTKIDRLRDYTVDHLVSEGLFHAVTTRRSKVATPAPSSCRVDLNLCCFFFFLISHSPAFLSITNTYPKLTTKRPNGIHASRLTEGRIHLQGCRLQIRHFAVNLYVGHQVLMSPSTSVGLILAKAKKKRSIHALITAPRL